jgi:hypothetical protein
MITSMYFLQLDLTYVVLVWEVQQLAWDTLGLEHVKRGQTFRHGNPKIEVAMNNLATSSAPLLAARTILLGLTSMGVAHALRCLEGSHLS